MYVIIRSCKDRQGNYVSPINRLEALLKEPEFALLAKQKESVMSRISIIAADMTIPGFGLSEEEAHNLRM